MRLPGGFQTERLVEMLEEGYGGEQMLEIERDIMQHGVRFQAYLDIGNQPASCWPGRPYRIIISGDVRTREKEPREADCLPAGSCMSGNVHVRLREKGGGQKWPCCTSLSSSMGSALFFLGEYANMILMRCGALHLTFVGLPSSGACVPAFLCNKPLRPKTSGRWSRGAFGEG
ncbi:hypothetical protein TSUD_198860 [Trifolium subterraneum]|uniref:Uncharacterized protein n=2 Tax=50 kb inversion clade TaxID=2231393 RepID=A0A2Z6MAP3_TRISU|nr:hypothetical protein TSUD_198860 [Trifolium subterraneum]